MHGYTVHVPEDGWRFDCDVPNCIRFISIYRDGHVIDGTRFRSELHQLVCGFDDAGTASTWGPSSTAGGGETCWIGSTSARSTVRRRHDVINKGGVPVCDVFLAHSGRVLQVLVSVVCQGHLAWLHVQLGG